MRTTREKLKAAHAAGRFDEAKKLTAEEQWRFHEMLSMVGLMAVVFFTIMACVIHGCEG